jgi:hypothetical protein
MFRFTKSDEGIQKPVCFVIDFARKKEKRDATLVKHIAFLLVAGRFWIRAVLTVTIQWTRQKLAPLMVELSKQS